MKNAGNLIIYIIIIGIVWVIGCAVLPYWNRYMIKSDLSAAALYGTKHSSDETIKYFSEKIKERGYDFDPEEFQFDKNERNTVSIQWTYRDEISVFGFVLKELEFTLDVTERETKEQL